MSSSFNIPFFIFDIANKQLITTSTIPTDLTDTKEIVLTEVPIPGLNFNPVTFGGNGNRKISFTLPLIKRRNIVGNVALLKQFENLRNQATGLFSFSSAQFTPNPKVLFYWGSGNAIPLEYFVSKCDPVHRSSFVNNLGFTQFSEISMELILDESSPIYQAEEIFRKVSSVISTVDGIAGLISNPTGQGESI